MCAGPWGRASFAGAIHEHRMVNETWPLPALGGAWTFLPPARRGRRPSRGPAPVIWHRAVWRRLPHVWWDRPHPRHVWSDHSVATPPSFAMLNDTWYWTLAGGWEELRR